MILKLVRDVRTTTINPLSVYVERALWRTMKSVKVMRIRKGMFGYLASVHNEVRLEGTLIKMHMYKYCY